MGFVTISATMSSDATRSSIMARHATPHRIIAYLAASQRVLPVNRSMWEPSVTAWASVYQHRGDGGSHPQLEFRLESANSHGVLEGHGGSVKFGRRRTVEAHGRKHHAPPESPPSPVAGHEKVPLRILTRPPH